MDFISAVSNVIEDIIAGLRVIYVIPKEKLWSIFQTIPVIAFFLTSI